MNSDASVRRRWDIFCTVIDNFGDIGITWRLARQLVHEHGLAVRLWVDDLATFRMLRPEIDPMAAAQRLEGVEIRHWSTPFPDTEPADVVVEALACHLPERYVEAMARQAPPPVWINLEYLTAEDWAAGCHGLPSPHPRLPLTKYFFFPGYTASTGGVLREADLCARRDAFQASPAEQRRFWNSLGLPEAAPGELRISLFGYENRAAGRLLSTWTEGPDPVTCLFPLGRLQGAVEAFFGATALQPGMTLNHGRLTLHTLPMLAHDHYDRLLWACDCNFVRGEDSFVRAQWAQRPMVWQAYRQEEDAHRAKIDAFLDLYGQSLDADSRLDLRAFWTAWNDERGADLDWPAYWRHHTALASHARSWTRHLDAIGDLTGNLVKFCNEKL